MYLLYTDETNLDPAGSTFFIYGGVAISSEKAPSISNAIGVQRLAHGYKPEYKLKFNTRECPHIDPEKQRSIKQAIVQCAAEHGCILFLSLINHKIATSPEDARKNEINRVCYNFNCFLHRVNDYGLVLVDTFLDAGLTEHLREKFNIGVKGLPFSNILRLDRILGFHVASVGTSHFSSVIDIVIGGVRYAINTLSDPLKRATAETLMRQVSPLLLRETDGRVSELAVFYSPKQIKAKAYLEEYIKVDEFFSSVGIDTQRKPTDERIY